MQKAKIIVAVRKRPLFQKQQAKGHTDIVMVNGTSQVVVSQMKQFFINKTGKKLIQPNIFKTVFSTLIMLLVKTALMNKYSGPITISQIYDTIIAPLIDSAFEGAKVSCFAYGQTGSGKTHTMNGVMAKNMPGLYTLGAMDIFAKLEQEQNSHLKAYLSFYQIYCTKLYDLLNKRSQLVLRQDGKSNINVVGLSQIPLSTVQQFQSYLKTGSSQRVTSQNSANSQSSRSHAILQITLKNGKKPFGKVYFIDLAGNERGADHMNMKKQTQKDGQQINKSLLQLKQCIRGLDQGKNHVPFRGSKLTMCLKDSFIGFCRTVMIGNLSPSSNSSQNTLNTLRYADRVKQLKNNQNGQLSKQQMKAREMMLPRQNKNAIKINISNSDDQDDIAQKKRQAMNNYGGGKVQQPQSRPAYQSRSKQLMQKRQRSSSKKQQDIAPVRKQSNFAAGPVSSNSLAKNGPVTRNASNSHYAQQQRKTVNNMTQSVTLPSNHHNSSQITNNLSLHSQNMQESIKERMRQQQNGLNSGRNHSNSNVNYNNNLNNNYQYQQQNQKYSAFAAQNDFSKNDYNNNSSLYTSSSPHQQQINGYSTPSTKAQHDYGFSNSNNANNSSSRTQLSQRQQSQQPSKQPISPMPRNQVPKTNNFFSNNSNAMINNNSPNSRQRLNTQQQQYVQKPLSQSRSQSHSLHHPETWNQLVNSITTAQANPSNNPSLQTRTQYHLLLNENLLQSENQLISIHSNTLQSEIQKIKQQMQTIKIIQEDRSRITSKQYAQIMYDSIDQKMSQLQQLKESLTTFMYKLDDMEEVQQKMEMYTMIELQEQQRLQREGAIKGRKNSGTLGQDEQLLDDF